MDRKTKKDIEHCLNIISCLFEYIEDIGQGELLNKPVSSVKKDLLQSPLKIKTPKSHLRIYRACSDELKRLIGKDADKIHPILKEIYAVMGAISANAIERRKIKSVLDEEQRGDKIIEEVTGELQNYFIDEIKKGNTDYNEILRKWCTEYIDPDFQGTFKLKYPENLIIQKIINNKPVGHYKPIKKIRDDYLKQIRQEKRVSRISHIKHETPIQEWPVFNDVIVGVVDVLRKYGIAQPFPIATKIINSYFSLNLSSESVKVRYHKTTS